MCDHDFDGRFKGQTDCKWTAFKQHFFYLSGTQRALQFCLSFTHSYSRIPTAICHREQLGVQSVAQGQHIAWEESGIEPPTLRLTDDHLYPLSHSGLYLLRGDRTTWENDGSVTIWQRHWVENIYVSVASCIIAQEGFICFKDDWWQNMIATCSLIPHLKDKLPDQSATRAPHSYFCLTTAHSFQLSWSCCHGNCVCWCTLSWIAALWSFFAMTVGVKAAIKKHYISHQEFYEK